MQRQNEVDEQAHLRGMDHAELSARYHAAMRGCHASVREIERQLCGLRKVRGELELLHGGGEEPPPVDCEVSPWTPEECSATCGGGSRRLFRSVLVHPQRGAACPPLEMVRPCSEESCPVDCVLGDWGGWSGCTAECGGGVRERTRDVAVLPSRGGEPCGQTAASEECGMEPCALDCTLGDWTDWSSCSRACGGGLELRRRNVEELAEGGGHCPAAADHERLLQRICNEEPCVHESEQKTLRCEDKLDVVLLIDGSGTVGTYGWFYMVKACKTLAEAMVGGDDKVRLAVQLFSGPRTWDALHECTRSDAGPLDAESKCGLKWVSHLTSNTQELAGKIEALQPPGASKFVSGALGLAEAELPLGRPDAKPVVLIITEGKPMSPSRTQQVAQRLRQRARLMWVTVVEHGPTRQVKEWASWPPRDNVIPVKDWPTLANASTVDAIVRNMCTKLR
mmetsp:Transcript_93384/g.301864  ORF Transcript_93384/g.301864 Transcript_93384/m.301864 type:complete len:451 (-) Transcript_93384:97-1449(-)